MSPRITRLVRLVVAGGEVHAPIVDPNGNTVGQAKWVKE